MKSIIYESHTPAKTFGKPIYLILGSFLTGLGVYYFISQANFGRPEEYVPLGLALVVGIYFLLAYMNKWKIPSSQPSFVKKEFFINPDTQDLEYIFKSQVVNNTKEVLFSLKEVKEIDYRVESASKTSTTQRVAIDVNKTKVISRTNPSGLYIEKTSTAYTEYKYYLVLKPINKEVLFNKGVPDIGSFVKDLNNLLKEIDNDTAKNKRNE